MKYCISLLIVLLFSQFSELKAFLPSPTTIRRLNSSARFYSSPEESASIRFEDIKFNIQEETTRAIKQLEEQNNAEIQALKHKLAATTGDAPIELEKNHVVSNSERSIKADLSSEECAQALTHFMTKSHEEKLSALKHLKENKDSVIKALKQQLQKKKDEERSLEHAAQEYSETITDMSRKIESAQKFISTYVVKKQEEKRRAIADAERVIAKKYEQKLKAFLLDPAPPGPDPTEASCDANRLFKRRNAKIVAAATVGKTRWGDMEVKKVIHVTTTSTTTTTSETAQKDDPNTTSLTLFDKKNSFSNSVVSKKVLMNDAMLLYCSAMHIRLKRVV